MHLVREPVLPNKVPQPLDQELLAWAAGFFDGEGSTILRTDSRRRGYHQLESSVPQSDPNGTPEVLIKFQRAMLGIGRISKEAGAMHKWIVAGRMETQIALALLWPWLGIVKREQARAAMDQVEQQYADGRFLLRAPRKWPALEPHDAIAELVPDQRRLEFAWAAGFIDAEGCFGLPKRYERKDGSVGFVLRVSAPQHGAPGVPAEVLLKLLRILGVGRIEQHGDVDDFRWVTEGTVNVNAVLEELRTWLGTVKVVQAETAIATAVAARVRGDAERCVRGHLYDRFYVRDDGTIHRICNSCERMNERSERAERGAKSRAVKNASLDPTRIYAS